MQSRRKGSNDLIVIKLKNGNMLTNEGDIAECMDEYFASALKLKTLIIFHHVINYPDKDLSLLHCSPKNVGKILSELNPRKSPGPDSIHPMILNKCAGTLAPSLSDVFNASLASGILLHYWKLADITLWHRKLKVQKTFERTIALSH